MARPEAMSLDEFHRYLDETRREVEACYAEIEEIQFLFNDIFKQELEAWQERFTFCFPRLLAQRKEMPQPFARRIDQVEEEERARLRTEIAALKTKVAESEQRLDALLAGARETAEALRQANPQLNEREEQVKKRIAQYEDEFTEAYEKLEELDGSLLGWLSHGGQIRRLKRAQHQAKKQQAEAVQQLREVRKTWQEQIDQAGEKQAELRQEWQALSIQTAQAKSELDQKTTSFDTLAEQAAVQRVLEELNEAPASIAGELGPAIEDLVQRNKVRWAYEEGLKAVAEALGLLKGVGEGLKRFRLSVGTVLQEQRRYSLKAVKVLLPPNVLAINETWAGLQEKVKDEKHMGTHPLEFSRVVKEQLSDRLTEAVVQSYFEQMGEALSQATKAWS